MTEETKEKKKTGPGIPIWMWSLPKGQYTIEEICEITGQKRMNVFIRFKLLKIPFQKNRNKVNCHKVNAYLWQGADYYLKQMCEKNKAAC